MLQGSIWVVSKTGKIKEANLKTMHLRTCSVLSSDLGSDVSYRCNCGRGTHHVCFNFICKTVSSSQVTEWLHSLKRHTAYNASNNSERSSSNIGNCDCSVPVIADLGAGLTHLSSSHSGIVSLLLFFIFPSLLKAIVAGQSSMKLLAWVGLGGGVSSSTTRPALLAVFLPLAFEGTGRELTPWWER